MLELILLNSVQNQPPNTERLTLEARPLSLLNQEPPKRVRLFQLGPNPTRSHGVLWLTDQCIQDCLNFEASLGLDLNWDWHHASEMGGSPNPAEDRKASGWFSLYGEQDGLYAGTPRHMDGANGIHWTPQGDRQIRSLEYRYFSPGVLVTTRNGRKEIVAVTSCALTNTPETLNQRPLMLAAHTQGYQMTWEQILAQLTARGASQAEIDQARRDFDAAQAQQATPAQPQQTNLSAGSPATPAQPGPTVESLQAQLNQERRTRILLTHARRFTPAERPTLETLPPDTLEALLAARQDLPITQPINLASPRPSTPAAGTPSPVTGGNNPISTNLFGGVARPWDQLSYREKAILYLAKKDEYRQMRRQASEQGRLLLATEESFARPIPNLKQIFLATGETLPADIVEVVPEVLNDAIEAGIAGMKIFQGSPVCQVRSDLPMWNASQLRPIKGGDTITMPYWETLGDFEAVSDESSVPTTLQKLETTEDTAAVVHKRLAVQLAYVTQAFAAQGSDPVRESSRQMLERAFKNMESGLITEVRTTGLSLDISDVGDGLLTYDAFVQAFEKWGDEEFEEDGSQAAMMFMHSNSLRQVRQIKDSQGRPIFTEAQGGGMPRVMGIPVRVSDLLTTVSSEHVPVIAKPGALALWYNASKLMVQSFHDVSTDKDLNTVHLYFAVALYTRPPRRTKQGAVKILHKAAA